LTHELIANEPRPPRPDLPGTVVIRPNADAVIDAIAADMLIHATNCVRTFGDFHLALSGGSTPLPLYERLMIDPRYRDLPWARTHLWIVDERRVPFDDERSNFKHISEIIADHSGIPPEQVHPIFAQRRRLRLREGPPRHARLARARAGPARLCAPWHGRRCPHREPLPAITGAPGRPRFSR
jgi:hypothetical protein